MSERPASLSAAGLLPGLAAYLWWGLSALYWRALAPVSAIDVVAHRALWVVPFCALLLAWRGRLWQALQLLRSPRSVLLLAVSSALIAINWGVFVWAVGAGELAQASLGYFIQPLLTVLFGLVFFRERLAPVQWLAVGFAAAGVAVYAASLGETPVVALAVALSFSIYGALRKQLAIDPLDGMFVEMLLFAPLALGWIICNDGAGMGAHGPGKDAMLVLAGVVTALPLMAYVSAARSLPLVTLGLLFYVNPSVQLLVAVCWFGEPLHVADAWSFSLVWIGVLLYLARLLYERRRLATRAHAPAGRV